MSGAIHVDSGSGSSHKSSGRESQRAPSAGRERPSTDFDPFRFNVFHPTQGQKEETEPCKCRRCHRGRPSRQDHHERKETQKRNRTSKSNSPMSTSPNSRSPQPRGILRRYPATEDPTPRLRKTVSFERGTKIPDDWDDTSQPDTDAQSGSKARDEVSSDVEAECCFDGLPDFDAQQSYEADQGINSGPPIDGESEVLGERERRPYSHSPARTECRNCCHCPGAARHQKRGRGSPSMRQGRPSSPRTAQVEEGFRSIVHFILLSMHQSWCKGDCGNLSKFVKKMGGCSACRTRQANAGQSTAGALIPNCRTLIHCRKFNHDILAGEGPGFPLPITTDRALRLGYADVYCCSIEAYLTVEEYLAYRACRINELDFGLWIREETVRKQIRNIKQGRTAGPSARRSNAPVFRFLVKLAEEVEMTEMLWMAVMDCAGRSGQPVGEMEASEALEDMAGSWKPRYTWGRV